MPTLTARAPIALLAFGLVALIGLIVLAGTDSLHDATVRDMLVSVASSCVAAAAGIAIPSHTHDVAITPPATPTRAAALPTAPNTAPTATTVVTTPAVYVPPGA